MMASAISRVPACPPRSGGTPRSFSRIAPPMPSPRTSTTRRDVGCLGVTVAPGRGGVNAPGKARARRHAVAVAADEGRIGETGRPQAGRRWTIVNSARTAWSMKFNSLQRATNWNPSAIRWFRTAALPVWMPAATP